ncbi:hypothetical protein AB0C51_08980 [Streptomyces pathocidini]|uniref:Uncharacterized protein n=1 Tax=Streptomyces pathocidini TaxID=1650571 RepID=A0ABW7UMS6_9ACTN|nr:hypothetical protein [Streptomyces pathocidini]
MISITKPAGREVIASCLPGASALRGIGLSGAAEARLVDRGIFAANERSTKAPADVAAAQAPAYVLAANGADLQQNWAAGFANGTTSAAEHHTMRAFRGLQPWRDPA